MVRTRWSGRRSGVCVPFKQHDASEHVMAAMFRELQESLNVDLGS